eukprot:1200840-Pyramimonas_sp.AAC.2
MHGMRSSERWPSHRRARTSVLDHLPLAGEGPRYHDLVPDRLRGVTVQYPCVRCAGTEAQTARPKRKAGVRGKLTNRVDPASVQCVET